MMREKRADTPGGESFWKLASIVRDNSPQRDSYPNPLSENGTLPNSRKRLLFG